MNSLAQDFCSHLVGVSSLALVLGTNLFRGKVDTDNVDGAVVAVKDTPGDDPEHGFEFDRPRCQVYVRGAKGSYANAYAIAQAVRKELMTLTANGATTINGTRYNGVYAVGDVNYITYDEENRPIFTANFRVHRSTA